MFLVYYQQYSRLCSTDRRAWCVSFELMWSFKLIWNYFADLNTLGFQDQVGGSFWVRVFVVAYLWFEFWSEEEEWAETTVFEINMSLFMYGILCGNSDNVISLPMSTAHFCTLYMTYKYPFISPLEQLFTIRVIHPVLTRRQLRFNKFKYSRVNALNTTGSIDASVIHQR